MDAVLVGVGLAVAMTAALIASFRMFPAGWHVRPLRLVPMTALLAAVLTFAAWNFGAVVTAEISLLGFAMASPVLVVRLRRARALEVALAGLAAPSTRAASLAEVTRLVGLPARSNPVYRNQANLWVYVAGRAARLGLREQAIAWLTPLDEAQLDPLTRAGRCQALAAAHIGLCDRARARALLASASRPAASPLFERAFVALEVLLEALEGDAAAAEARASACLAKETDTVLRSSFRCALAHALAAQGHFTEAREQLKALAAAADGAATLARVVDHRGPASAIAQELLTDRGEVYR